MSVTRSRRRLCHRDSGFLDRSVTGSTRRILRRESGALALGGSLLALVLFAGCRGPEAKEGAGGAAPEVPVRVATVRDTLLTRSIAASGLVAAKEEIPLSFKIGGVVARVEVEEGQTVRSGEVLAALEASEIDAQVAKAQAAEDRARRDLSRAHGLFQDSVVTRTDLDGAELAASVAESDLRIVRFNQRYARIVAPAGGTILRRLADPGQTVGPGIPVLVLGAASRGQIVRVGLVDRDAALIAPGDPAELTFSALPGVRREGKVTGVGAAASPGTGTYEAKILLDQTVALGAGGPVSGLVADVLLHPSRPERLRLVPLESLVEGNGAEAGVWCLKSGGTIERRRVHLAYLGGGWAAVDSGVAAGDRIITAGAAYLTPTSRLRIEGR